MAGGGGGGGGGSHPQKVFQFSRAFLQTKVLAVGSSVPTYRLGSKIKQRDGAGGRGGGLATTPTEQKLTYFSDHEDDIQY